MRRKPCERRAENEKEVAGMSDASLIEICRIHRTNSMWQIGNPFMKDAGQRYWKRLCLHELHRRGLNK